MTIDKWSRDNYPLPQIPEFVFKRHFRRRLRASSQLGMSILALPGGWYIHVYRNGVMKLSTLPF